MTAICVENDRINCSSLGREVLRLLGIKGSGSILVSLLHNGSVLVEKETVDVDA
jgi:hypothetical protein